MKKYLVIADDFTGSNDTGVQMKKRGLPVQVLLYPAELERIEQSVVLDTESRNMPAVQAEEKVSGLCAQAFERADFSLVYKKVDSTLRGNIQAELKAVLAHYPADKVLFAPAFPAIGRTSLNGVHYLNGRPLLESEMAKDPLKPLQSDRLEDYVKGLGGAIVQHSLEEIRGGSIDLSGGFCHCFDAEEYFDLAQIAAAGLSSGQNILWVGSAGLADALFALLHPPRPVLSLVGSISQISFEQLAAAMEKGITLLQIGVEDFLDGTDLEHYVEIALNTLRNGQDLILSANFNRDDYENSLTVARQKDLLPAQASARLQVYLGRLTRAIVDADVISGLFLTGGDTAIAVLDALQAGGSHIVREIETGVVLSTLAGGAFHGLHCVTKAGAFGRPDSLIRAIESIKEL